MAKATSEHLIPVERIAAQIYMIRGESVMLDDNLAELYGVSTKVLNVPGRKTGPCIRCSVRCRCGARMFSGVTSEAAGWSIMR